MTEAPAPLEPLDEDWQRALCVVAHPDDMEFGAASAVARWTGQGKWVGYTMVTSGEAGIDGMAPDECRTVREAEQVESARIVGVDTVDFLHQPDGVLEYGVPMRRLLAAEVRRHRPDIVITGNFRDTWGGRNLNESDHIVDTTDTFDAGVESLKAHAAYIEGLGWENWDPREFLEGMARGTGQRMGTAFAAPFEVFPMGWGD